METFQFDNLALVALLPMPVTTWGSCSKREASWFHRSMLALHALKDDGTLDTLIAEWLPVPEDLRELGR